MWQHDLKELHSLDGRAILGLEKLLGLLLHSKDRSLTAVSGELNIVRFHFFDSLSLLSLDELVSASKIVDLGSGAGFPGLPLALAQPGKQFTLLDSSSKKCAFLRSAVTLLALNNVDVVRARSEAAAAGELRDSFDLVLARAVGPLATVIELAMPLVRPGGAAVLQRGAVNPEDRKIAPAVAAGLNSSLSRHLPVYPYPGAKNLHVWVFLKEGPTPSRFPRRPGLARKRPLGGR